MRNYITLYVNVTAEDFYNWLVVYLEDDGPLETFYDTILPDGGFIWTPIDIMHDPATEPNWWRYAVGLTEDWQGETIITADDGALDFCFTQSRANPHNPRAEIAIGWDELFPGTVWELLSHLTNAYPETQPTIDSWKKTSEGQQAGEAAAICTWWGKYISGPYYALLRYTDMADPNLTNSEFQAQYFQTEEGAQIVGAAKKVMRSLSTERQEWLFKMLDLGQYRYDMGRYLHSETPEERQKAMARALESYKRIESWWQLEIETLETLPDFEQWARETGYIPPAEVSAPVGDVVSIEARQSPPAEKDTLTESQEKVLFMVGEGLSNQEIAARASFSAGTVKNYISRLYAYFGLDRSSMGDEERRERLSEKALEYGKKL